MNPTNTLNLLHIFLDILIMTDNEISPKKGTTLHLIN
jgi:hypothetical protein